MESDQVPHYLGLGESLLPRMEVGTRHSPDSTGARLGLQLYAEEWDMITYTDLWRSNKHWLYLIVHSGSNAGSLVGAWVLICIWNGLAL